jgi:hypothetical protein
MMLQEPTEETNSTLEKVGNLPPQNQTRSATVEMKAPYNVRVTIIIEKRRLEKIIDDKFESCKEQNKQWVPYAFQVFRENSQTHFSESRKSELNGR